MLAKATPQAASYDPFPTGTAGPIPSLAEGQGSNNALSKDSVTSAAGKTSSRLSKEQVEALVKADADWESDMLSKGLGADDGMPTRKLMQTLVTCTALSKLNQVVSTRMMCLLLTLLLNTYGIRGLE